MSKLLGSKDVDLPMGEPTTGQKVEWLAEGKRPYVALADHQASVERIAQLEANNAELHLALKGMVAAFPASDEAQDDAVSWALWFVDGSDARAAQEFVERIRKEERKRCIAILEKTKDPTMKDPLWDGALMHAISELETLE